MNSGTILVTGASGFVGWNVVRYFASKGADAIGTYCTTMPSTAEHCKWLFLPLESGAVTRVLTEERPAVIVHCAAVPGIAQCEADRIRAFKVNVDATCRVAEAAERLQIPMVYVSTDLVFDGIRGWYDEDDLPKPPTYYGETKLLGEQETLSICTRAMVVRLALTYGLSYSGFGGFLNWTHDGLRQGRELKLFENQYRTILFVEDIPLIIEALLRAPNYGIFHAAGPDRLNRVEIGRLFAAAFRLQHESITAVRLERGAQFGDMDDTSLLTGKLQRTTGFTPTSYKQGLQRLSSSYAPDGDT